MLTRLADYCYRSRRLVIAAWAGCLIALALLAGIAAGKTSDDYTVPGSGSEHALQLLRAHGLSDDQTDSMRVVFRDQRGLDADPPRAAIEAALERLRQRLPGASVAGPFGTGAHGQISRDRTVAYAQVVLAHPDGTALTDAQLHAVPDKVTGITPALPGLQTAFAGPMFETAKGGGAGEGIGILAAAVILLVAFGSVLAMGLPLLVALFGAGCGVAAVTLVAGVVPMSSAAVPLAAMLAVGVGIDYSLLMVTRYREGLVHGLDPRESVSEAQHTAGRSVLFAGTTVVVAVLGLLVMNMALINGVAIGAALAVAITMTASLTLLPALLGFAGTNIDRFGLPHRRKPTAGRGQFARRWSRSVQRRPWPYAIGSLLVLAVLTVPAVSMRLGFTGAGTLPPGNTARQASEMLAAGFGPGANGPLFAVIDTAPRPVSQTRLGAVRSRIAATPGVAGVSTPIVSRDERLGMLAITPTTGPGDAATADLARRVRDHVLPDALDRSAHGYLTGATAAAADFSDFTGARLPAFLAVVLAVAFVLLMLVFRSLLVPLKAVTVNLLSIGASFGVVVAAVQWGWGSRLFGLDMPIPVIAWVPMMMVAVVFGLSMDYEVFLLSRMKEHHDAGEPNARAVASGLASTARVITAAAAIMICVFASFMLGSEVDLAVFGFGLAIAVLIDASLVRMILVPAVMELLGERNWWLPPWLSRKLPRLPVHGRPRRPPRPVMSAGVSRQPLSKESE